MWQWVMMGLAVLAGLLVLLVLWSLLEMAARGEEEMEDHRLEACATKDLPDQAAGEE